MRDVNNIPSLNVYAEIGLKKSKVT